MEPVDSEYRHLENGTHFVRIVDSYSDGWLEYQTPVSIDTTDWR